MKNIIVVDDFYDQPEKVQRYARTKAKYISADLLNSNFPGTESVHSFITPSVIKKIESALGFEISVDPSQFSFGVFAKTYSKDKNKKRIHVDSCECSGIVYLNSQEQCVGGTVFYQHKSTGLSEIPTHQKLIKMGYTDETDFKKRFLVPQESEYTAWNISAKVGMKFNRLVLFKSGQLFHAAENYFGDSEDTCRLTQLFFFQTKESV